MDIYKETFETWDKVASLYEAKFMDLDLYNETYDVFCDSLIKPNAAILEIGCGPGNIAKYVLARRPDFSLLGIDIAPRMIALAAENNPTAHFKVMDCRFISDIKSNFDGIICGFCLPYLIEEDCSKLISDCAALLNDKGLLYLSFVEGKSSHSGFKTGSSGDRTYFHYYLLSDIENLLHQNKFDEPKRIKVSYENANREKEIHTILIAKKISNT